eukprot:TRINITY_DN2875_c0_g1_i2.p1 TRINITY_DN2875_c0_g1~~TRINITY_DN2875_c0_g1_i2.p1  ORF type:complete len:183 (+),score=35.42 TRINITY_DN2875_c0_g1_i2:74-550(+)
MVSPRCLLLVLLTCSGLASEQAPMSALLEDDECEQGIGDCGLNALQVQSSQGSDDFEELESQLNETGRMMTLYHVTSPRIGHMILKQGFKSGHAGWCGGGIYFATSAGATRRKAIGFQSHQGFLIEATLATESTVRATTASSSTPAMALRSSSTTSTR